MKRRLFFIAALAAALSLSPPEASAARQKCFEENYGGGTCATTCVSYNNQGSVEIWDTTFHPC